MTVLALAACNGGSDPKGPTGGKNSTAPPGSSGGGKAIASQPMAYDKGPARIDLVSVDRSTANTVLVRFRMANESQQPISVSGNLNHPESQGNYSADGVTLLDAVNNKRYFPLMSTNQTCLCSSLDSVTIPPGQAKDLFALLPAPPADLQRIAVSVPLTPAFLDVPIGAGPVKAPEADPAKTSLQPPKILPLINTVEGDEQSLDEDDATQKVRLSSDVLFALNKANLSPRARSVLQGVAQRVNASQGNTVTIDGYTDTSGNDAINQPLSERRAQSVEGALRGLVTRQGVTYKSAGHGSADPVADNATDAGRKKNRRVTVTFARPVPPKATAPPSSPPAANPPATGGKLPVIATAQPQSTEVQSTKLEVNSLHREASGLVQLTWTVTNTGSQAFDASARFAFGGDLPMNYEGGSTPGVNLHDTTNGMYYRSLRDKENRCICSDFIGVGRNSLNPGDSVTFYNLYKLPPEVQNIAVEIPEYAAIKSVPIG
jgi:outer membrane protein OmpA-like peptidoglycan-associated protein